VDPPLHDVSRAAELELRSKNERLKLLLDLNNAVVSNLELRDLLRAIASSVRQVMKCDSIGVALPDPEDQRLRIYAVDFPEGKGLIREESKVPSADGPTSRAFRNSEPLALDAHALAGLDAGDLAVADDRSADVHTVAAEELGGRIDRDIDAVLERAKQCGREHRTVHNHRQPQLVRRVGNAAEIH
jgi:transcriptional regulator with GAF, ATPase, and Fis domain